MKFFDSKHEKPGSRVAGGVPHISFHLEGTDDLLPRESLEVRVICVLVRNAIDGYRLIFRSIFTVLALHDLIGANVSSLHVSN